jgi:hypothetical protein
MIPATDKPDHMGDDLAASFGKQPDTKQRTWITSSGQAVGDRCPVIVRMKST